MIWNSMSDEDQRFEKIERSCGCDGLSQLVRSKVQIKAEVWRHLCDSELCTHLSVRLAPPAVVGLRIE